MTDRPLSVAEVLNDELEYLTDSSIPEDDVWRFLPQDVYDVQALIDKVRSHTPPRYRMLIAVLRDPTAECVAKVLNARLRSATLLRRLLADPEFGGAHEHAIVWNDPKLLGGLLTNAGARARFLEEPQAKNRLGFLLRNVDYLVNALDEGETIADLLRHYGRTTAIADAVRKRPRLLGAIITSRAVRIRLRDFDDERKRLVRACDDASFDPGDVDAVVRLVTEMPEATAVNDGSMCETRVNALLLEAAFRDHLHDHVDEKVAFERLRSKKFAALCLSGGGIRSATFNLGVLQALARNGILDQVNYLSTVSGGGYIGSWLSSWMRRHEHGTRGVLNDLRNPPNDPLEPEPKPVVHLREYSNYLAPRAGLFTVDTWTLIGTYLRNLSLIWFLLLPPLVLLLVLPRLFELAILTPSNATAWSVAGVIFLFWSTLGIGSLRPVRNQRNADTARHFVHFLIPGYLSAITFAIALAQHWYAHRTMQSWTGLHVFGVAFGVLAFLNLAGAALYLWRYMRAVRRNEDPLGLGWKVTFEIAAPLFGAAFGALALSLITSLALRNPIGADFDLVLTVPEQFAIFSVPLMLLVLFVEAAAFVGVVTRVSADYDREWWARSMAMMSLGAAGWIGVTAISIVGPALLLQSPKIIGAFGGLSAVVSAVAGYSKKTPAKEHRRSTRMALNAVATVALVAVLSALSLLIDVAIPVRPFEPHIRRPAYATAHVSGTTSGVERKPAGKPTSRIDAALAPTYATTKHISRLRNTDAWLNLRFVVQLALIAILLGVFLDANDYSMHSMYRNRLIRAYLGGSRWNRAPDRFTGFDPEDNLQMYQLRPHLLWRGSFTDFRGFVTALKKHKIYGLLPQDVRGFVDDAEGATAARLETLAPLIYGAINELMLLDDLKTRLPARRTLKRLRENRAYLQQEFESWLERVDGDRPPLHILNMTLNLVSGDNLAWQQRKAESFTVSMLHAGSAATQQLGYRDSVSYGGRRGISLGTALAISGAAVSPNQGYNSSAVVTFIMTLFNARLGWWLGNPGSPGESTWTSRGPAWALFPLLKEAFGQTNDRSPYIFLSDGGHFENLGLYEMVRRRCRFIIVCDAAADPNYDFGDLGNAIRKIRVDFGIPIDFKHFCIGPDPCAPDRKRAAAYCAIGTIHYDGVDCPRNGDPVEDGQLLYIKPAVYADCPEDVKNYERIGKPFPQESTADQFFDETQFESYRILGAHIIETIAGNAGDPHAFFQAAQRYLTRHQHEHGC